ncbi:unnamed protein product [Dracunculus medinensis]|uniref:Uncharacterized protein n=1 Tax=Dracunculus medinensis TaxID=318479 RepID=A0A0N4U9G8_DRAME|nr:unnamed protein product [Dracunculus medinensis]
MNVNRRKTRRCRIKLLSYSRRRKTSVKCLQYNIMCNVLISMGRPSLRIHGWVVLTILRILPSGILPVEPAILLAACSAFGWRLDSLRPL